jgi:hypothetical protein
VKTIAPAVDRATFLAYRLVSEGKQSMNNVKALVKGTALKVCIFLALVITIFSCRKPAHNGYWHYYEIGFQNGMTDWRDSSFVVATANPSLISAINVQLSLPVSQRKIVNGLLLPGNGGYNKNASHQFKWHLKENAWHLDELSIEIFDGRPYNDIDINIDYWLDTVKRFAPWGSYIKREISLP